MVNKLDIPSENLERITRLKDAAEELLTARKELSRIFEDYNFYDEGVGATGIAHDLGMRNFNNIFVKIVDLFRGNAGDGLDYLDDFLNTAVDHPSAKEGLLTALDNLKEKVQENGPGIDDDEFDQVRRLIETTLIHWQHAALGLCPRPDSKNEYGDWPSRIDAEKTQDKAAIGICQILDDICSAGFGDGLPTDDAIRDIAQRYKNNVFAPSLPEKTYNQQMVDATAFSEAGIRFANAFRAFEEAERSMRLEDSLYFPRINIQTAAGKVSFGHKIGRLSDEYHLLPRHHKNRSLPPFRFGLEVEGINDIGIDHLAERFNDVGFSFFNRYAAKSLGEKKTRPPKNLFDPNHGACVLDVDPSQVHEDMSRSDYEWASTVYDSIPKAMDDFEKIIEAQKNPVVTPASALHLNIELKGLNDRDLKAYLMYKARADHLIQAHRAGYGRWGENNFSSPTSWSKFIPIGGNDDDGRLIFMEMLRQGQNTLHLKNIINVGDGKYSHFKLILDQDGQVERGEVRDMDSTLYLPRVKNMIEIEKRLRDIALRRGYLDDLMPLLDKAARHRAQDDTRVEGPEPVIARYNSELFGSSWSREQIDHHNYIMALVWQRIRDDQYVAGQVGPVTNNGVASKQRRNRNSAQQPVHN
jgi:hypothetical protein